MAMPDDMNGCGGSGHGHASPAPERVGAYRIQHTLAAGGFGVVYRAWDEERGAPAAVKVLHAELAASSEVVTRFEREVEALQRVKHPNVIEVFGCGRLEDGRPYYAMELLSGVSLKEHIDVRGRLPLDEVFAILEPLCAAVSAAHARSIIHRDIKASNVFLCDAAGGQTGGRVILLDFGVAKLLDVEGPGLTSSRHMIGTIACMAPEQLLSAAVDERTDVYALGVLVYRLLTGAPPFAARSIVAMQQMHLYATPSMPSLIAPVSAAFDAPVLRALSKDRGARQPGAEALLRELRAAAGRSGVEEERRALAIYVNIDVDADAVEAGDERTFEDMEGIFPFVHAALDPAGFKVVMLTGSSTLLAIALPDGPEQELEARRRGLDVARELDRQIERRPGRTPGVHVRLCIHVVAATADAVGAIVGGPLLQVAAWVPELTGRSLASTSALSDLGEVAAHAGGAAWLELRPGDAWDQP